MRVNRYHYQSIMRESKRERAREREKEGERTYLSLSNPEKQRERNIGIKRGQKRER